MVKSALRNISLKVKAHCARPVSALGGNDKRSHVESDWIGGGSIIGTYLNSTETEEVLSNDWKMGSVVRQVSSSGVK